MSDGLRYLPPVAGLARRNGEIVPDCIDLKLYLEADGVRKRLSVSASRLGSGGYSAHLFSSRKLRQDQEQDARKHPAVISSRVICLREMNLAAATLRNHRSLHLFFASRHLSLNLLSICDRKTLHTGSVESQQEEKVEPVASGSLIATGRRQALQRQMFQLDGG
ncbi:hypothetical protein F2P81_000166 [Scophthalmus maximus]|uniref:Uncharacterized protein n=1 Tax=Scophthalmus maximus TaxID=52904 RepID=A0A6A4TKF0_SCOMX|nr:hypothetical protein F2P81_000166 [Scophthalmus maximus]